MSENKTMRIVLNAVLCGASAFGFIKIAPADHPYGFGACVIGFVHGVSGVLRALMDDENVRKLNDWTRDLTEVVPLALFNVDLFLGGDANIVALGHGLFVLPLSISLALNQLKDDVEYAFVNDTLKTMSVLGNVTSLVFLAINESSYILGGMAGLAFLAKFGAEWADNNYSDPEKRYLITYICWSGFFILAAMAVSGEK